MTKLRFAHLSDIHFAHASKIGTDPDDDVRNELVRDLRRQVTELGPITAVLVSGDIAYSGKPAEYALASSFLEDVCEAGQCKVTDVVICPGNHDVDRAVLSKNSLITDAQERILGETAWQAVDAALTKRVSEPDAGRFMYLPIEAFNAFAARFECTFTPDRFSWDRDFELNDGSTLRIRSLNSTLTSGPRDAQGRLCIGSRGWTLKQDDGVEYVVMAHHPPSWLRDGNDFDTHISNRARLQLFGHEHNQRILPTRDFVRLYAGSVNPERTETNWHPGYNLIDVWIGDDDRGRYMVIEVRMREWSRNPVIFQAQRGRDGSDVDRTEIRLEKWSKPSARATGAEVSTATGAAMKAENSKADKVPDVRDITHRFFRLNLSERSAIAGGLELLDDSDASLPDFERNARALKRARQEGKWGELVRMIEQTESKHA